MPKLLRAALAAAVAATLLAACNTGGDELTIYSGRNENLVRPILERFTKDTGIKIKVRYGDTAELAATILEEGRKTKADVFFSQDAGALAALDNEGLLGPMPAVVDTVDSRFKDPENEWVGVTGRVRVMAYNTGKLKPEDIPDSVFELTDPKWKDRVGFPPSNASFIAFVSALTEQNGRDRVKQWLEDMKANGAKRFDNNILTVEAVGNGEIDLGLVNHYYLYAEFKQKGRSVPVANHYPDGTFVNVAGVGILRGTKKSGDAQKFVEYMLGRTAQEYFRDETSEYPLAAGVEALPELPRLTDLKTIDVPLSRLGGDLQASLNLLKEVGLT